MPVGLSGIHVHSGARTPFIVQLGTLLPVAPLFPSMQIRSCGRTQQSRVQRKSSNRSGGLGQAGCVPAFPRKATPGPQGSWRGLPFPFFLHARIAGREAGAYLPRPLLKHCLTALLSSSLRRFSEPPSGVIKSPPALRCTPGPRAAQRCRSCRELGLAGHLHPCGGQDPAPEGLQAARRSLKQSSRCSKPQTHPEPGRI